MVFLAEDKILIVWPASSPDLNVVDYRMWRNCRSISTGFTGTGFVTLIS